jgi:hypothetical protein
MLKIVPKSPKIKSRDEELVYSLLFV